jgi:hypothetical protein
MLAKVESDECPSTGPPDRRENVNLFEAAKSFEELSVQKIDAGGICDGCVQCRPNCQDSRESGHWANGISKVRF